jgi:peptide/nickel transport system permease protein
VVRLVGERIPRTLALACTALFVQLILGIPLGIIAALRRGSLLDYGTITVALLGISTPTFVTGLVLQYWLAYRLRWLPLDGYGATSYQQALSMVLPALTLGIFGAAVYARFVRDEMLSALSQDYVRTAVAKGLSPVRVIGHALRNALLPVITLAGMDLGSFIGGTVVTEKLFRWPGLGSLMVDSVASRDGPVVMGLVIIGATAVLACNWVVDGMYAIVDPRTGQGD